jgi:CheY-like chemotaxis protein
MRGAVDLTDYSLRSNGIKINWEVDDALLPIWGDPDQLHQVLVNILINACQALQECTSPRELTLRATSDPRSNLLAIEVADNGPGVPPEIARRIFDPFFTTKPQGAGTGIGLSFCQGIVEAHGGSLRLVSSSGGATFRIELPTIASQFGTAERALPHRAVTSAMKGAALIIDDEPDLARALARLVEREGYDVDIADGGRTAKEKLQAHDYRVILSDLRMPDVDGPALYAWIGDERPGLRDRVAFVTGDTLGPGAIDFLTRSGRPFLGKPFTRESLRELLQRIDPDHAGQPAVL